MKKMELSTIKRRIKSVDIEDEKYAEINTILIKILH